ncbi:hypothetical protein ACQ4PT_069898 [Festuca glaucescens]
MGALISTFGHVAAFILAPAVEGEDEEVAGVGAALPNASDVEAQGTVGVGEGLPSSGTDAMAAFDHVGVGVHGPGLDKEEEVAGVGAALPDASDVEAQGTVGVGEGLPSSGADVMAAFDHVGVGVQGPGLSRVEAQGTVGVREGVLDNGAEAVESSGYLALNILAPGVEEEVDGASAGVANADGVQAPVVGEGEVIGGGPGGNLTEVIILTIGSQGTAIVAAIKKGVREVSASTADSYKVAYLLAIAAVFVASLAQLLGAIWVSYNTRERGAAGKKILYASVVTLVFGILLDAIACLLKK